MSWLKNAIHQTTKPKESVIGVLKEHLGGPQPGRSRETVHASDITKTDFCPRKWALYDVLEKKTPSQYVATALDVTFQMGLAAETLFVEEWAGSHVIGNWQCHLCGAQQSMVSKPGGFCLCFEGGRKHEWKYRQLTAQSLEFGVDGNVDCLFDVGTPRWLIVEVKTLNPDDFEKIVVPQPEHRLRTNLYMKLFATSPYKDKINLLEARVLYISRGYGKMNATWNEILPFKEFVVARDEEVLKPVLQRAKALNLFRTGHGMPSGICATATDKIAQKCSVCKECFSGDFQAVNMWGDL